MGAMGEWVVESWFGTWPVGLDFGALFYIETDPWEGIVTWAGEGDCFY